MIDDRLYLDERLDILCDGTEINHRDYTVISVKEYDRLLRDSAFLDALEAAGVDNWCGYDEAWRIFEDVEEDL